MIYEKVYRPILQEASEAEAIEFARGFVWSEEEHTARDILPSVVYIDTVDAIGVYYSPGAGYYFFTDESREDHDSA